MLLQLLKQSLLGYWSLIKGFLALFVFLAVIVLSGFVIAFPLWKMAISYRAIYNAIALALLGGWVLLNLIRRIKNREKGDLKEFFFFIGGLGLFWLTISIPENFWYAGVILMLFYQGSLVYAKKQKLISPLRLFSLSLLGVLSFIYWIGYLWGLGGFYSFCFLLGLAGFFCEGLILYNKKSYGF